MKVRLTFIFFLLFIQTSFAQSNEEIKKRFIDTLKMRMDGTYSIGRDFYPFKNSSIKGELFTNENLKNKITIINFWFEACHPCIAETDALNILYSDFKDNNNFQFLSFTFDKAEGVKNFIEKNAIQYPVISLTRDSCYLLNFKSGFPTTFITNTEGKIVFYHCGGSIDPDTAKMMIQKEVYPILKDLLLKLK